MPKPKEIELGEGTRIPILYEDRSVLAIDKPPSWMLIPLTWQKTDHNLQLAITSSIAAGDFWARSRQLKYLRYIHRLDAETTGILLFAKTQGALDTFSDLFESRKMEKVYLAVVEGRPSTPEWTSTLALAPDPDEHGRMLVDKSSGKEAKTSFRILQTGPSRTLIEARPVTGRTHQIRIHLAESGHPVVGDPMYGRSIAKDAPMGLRAVLLRYTDPFTRKQISIRAPQDAFLRQFGFASQPPASQHPTRGRDSA